MAGIEDGGPAFPQSVSRDADGGVTASYDFAFGAGMSLRDYFAAHAPLEPQPWFVQVGSNERPKSTYNHDHAVCAYPWDCIADNRDEQRAWDIESGKQWCTQWPWAWADAMLKAREAK